MSKKSFLMYIDSLDILDEMTDSEAGILFKLIKQYQTDGSEPGRENPLRLVFIHFKNQFDRDLQKYEKRVNTLKINGKMGGRPVEENQIESIKTKSSRKKPNQTDLVILKPNQTDKNQIEPIKTKSDRYRSDNVNVNVNDNVNDNVNVSDSVNDNENNLLNQKEKNNTKKEKVFSKIDDYIIERRNWFSELSVEDIQKLNSYGIHNPVLWTNTSLPPVHYDLSEIILSSTKDKEWMYNLQQKFGNIKFQHSLEDFVKHILSSYSYQRYKSEYDYRSHYVNWLEKNKSKYEK